MNLPKDIQDWIGSVSVPYNSVITIYPGGWRIYIATDKDFMFIRFRGGMPFITTNIPKAQLRQHPGTAWKGWGMLEALTKVFIKRNK